MNKPKRRWLTNVSRLEFARYRQEAGVIITMGPPQATDKYTSPQLLGFGMVGVYTAGEKKVQEALR